MPANVFQEIVDLLDLEASVVVGSKSSDLLPRRYEDRVGGQLGLRFSERLRSKLERGRYDPVPAEFVRVPKRNNTTRPAALLTLEDRVVYAALVEALRLRIEAQLLNSEIVYWPRGELSAKRWADFDNAPQTTDAAYVACADVGNFYDSIDHEELRDSLIHATGRRQLVNALIEFLARVMSRDRGIPQGPDASDAIATAFLSSVDRAMAREYVHYSRHGDDFRIATPDYATARRTLFDLETHLRARQLSLSSPKALVYTMQVYEARRIRTKEILQDTRRLLYEGRVQRLEEDETALASLIEESGEAQLGWDFFYHGNMETWELIEALEEHIKPSDAEVAERVFREAIDRQPSSNGRNVLSREEFHSRVTSCLVRLAAAKSPDIIDLLPGFLTSYPDKTKFVVSYLMSLPDDYAQECLEIAFGVIEDDGFHTEWEISWLLGVILRHAHQVSEDHVRILDAIATDETAWPTCRTSALKVLGRRGRLERQLVQHMLNVYSNCHQPDLVAAVYFARETQPWADPFLDTLSDDPVNRVVVRQLSAR